MSIFFEKWPHRPSMVHTIHMVYHACDPPFKIPQDSPRFPFWTSTRSRLEVRGPRPPLVFLFLFSPSLPQPQKLRADHLPRDQKRSALVTRLGPVASNVVPGFIKFLTVAEAI